MATPGPRYRSEVQDLSVATSYEKDITTAATPLQFPSTFTSSKSSGVVTEVNTRSGFMSDVVVENFHQRRHQGAIFNNQMDSGYVETKSLTTPISTTQIQTACAYDHSDWSKHYIVASDTRLVGDISYEMLAGSSQQASSFISLAGIPSMDVQRIVDIAVTQAWANVDQSEILSLACAKEANKTASGLISTTRKVVDIFRTVKKFDTRKLKGLLFQDSKTRAKKLKSIASQAEDVYMEARYNLRPLYYDMLGTLKLTLPSRPRQTFRGEAADESTLTDSCVWKNTSSLLPTLGTGIYFKCTRQASKSVYARAGVLTDIEDPGLGNRSGLTALPQTVWELIPYSFIADWFFNVGDTLMSWVPKPGINTLASWVTIQTIEECSNVISLDHYDRGTGPVTPWSYGAYGHTIDVQMGTSTKSLKTFKKWRLPHPSRAIMPKFIVNLDPLKKLDLFIILKQMISYRRI